MDDMGAHILLANMHMHRQSSPRAGDGVASVAWSKPAPNHHHSYPERRDLALSLFAQGEVFVPSDAQRV